MRSPVELVRYLNDYFLPQVWFPAGDLLGTNAASEAANALDDIPLCSGLSAVRLDFDTPPSVAMTGTGEALHIRVPGAGSLTIEGDVTLTDPLPDSGLKVSIYFELDVGQNPPEPAATLDVDFSLWTGAGRAAVAFFTPGLFLEGVGLEADVQWMAETALKSRIEDRLRGLRSYRFDTTKDFIDPVAGEPKISFVPSRGFFGSNDPAAVGYIDLLLVADGCGLGELDRFNKFASALAEALSASSSDLPEPYLQFRSNFRIWTLPILTTNPADELERVVFPILTDRNTVSFSNLARLAEIGLMASERFSHHPVVIIISAVSKQNLVRAGMLKDTDPPNSDVPLRANTQGPYVLMRLHAEEQDVHAEELVIKNLINTVLHELGHSPLGRYLADEYDTAGKFYKGPEPRPRNVASTPLTGWFKWQPWASWPQSGNLHPGAYEHSVGMYRFAYACRMRDSDFSSFCRICREELAFGLLENGHKRTGSGTQIGAADVLVEYLEPWSEELPQRVRLYSGSIQHLDVLVANAPNFVGTRVRLSLVGSTVPEDWSVIWHISQNGGGVSGDRYGRVIEIAVREGASVQISVRYLPNAGSSLYPPYPPNNISPETSGTLVFDIARQIDLLPPDELRQSVQIGKVLVPVINEANGDLRLPESLWVEARNTGDRSLSLATAISFLLEAPGLSSERRTTGLSLTGMAQRWTVENLLPEGRYVWSASTTWEGLRSPSVYAPQSKDGICWEIGAIPFAKEPRSPVLPFDPIVLEAALLIPTRPIGLQASSWHPNGRRIKFQFEIKLASHPFDQGNLLETEYLSPDPSNTKTLAVTGSVPLTVVARPGAGDLYHWQVRAADAFGPPSAWVEGPRFFLYLSDGRPKDVNELIRFITDERIEDFLRPRGPNGVRLYLINDRGSADGGQAFDLSGLKQLRTT